jgi:hypothetical protein
MKEDKMKKRYGIYILYETMIEFKKKCLDIGMPVSIQLEKIMKEWLKRVR